MKKAVDRFILPFEKLLTRMGIGMRGKLIIIFLLVKVVPLILLTLIAWRQIVILGEDLKEIAVSDSAAALNDSAIENIERMTTDTAKRVADFLYARDNDIRYLADLEPTEENFRRFAESRQGSVMARGEWELAADGLSWVPLKSSAAEAEPESRSTNTENNDMDGFHYRHPDDFENRIIPLYDEITFVDLNGVEQVKVVTASPKTNYPMSREKKNVSQRENTYVKAESYFARLQEMKPGEIYVSDVIGAYVPSNYIGMYAPEVVGKAAQDRGYDIPYNPEEQAYAGEENPNGQRFEGIVRWASPVEGPGGEIIGYVTFALNHDHIMEFVDHITPMNERYTELPSAFEGNYAFIWDYQCRSICHPRHHSIVGVDPETGDPEIPWMETSIYEAWQASGVEKWDVFVRGWPLFDQQSRSKKPAPALTQAGLVGLDGRYLNNAPQCTGWMDLTRDGGSGSFYILWSGLYKLTTAAAIPYYTGQYAPSEQNDYSLRGFGIVTIGAGLEDFARPADEMEERLGGAVERNLSDTFLRLVLASAIIILLVVLIAIWMASSITGGITRMNKGISRFRAGERQFRFNSLVKDEFGILADSFDDMADSIVDSVKNAFCITDMERRIIYMNDYGLELCGVKSLEEIAGLPYGAVSVYPTVTQWDPINALIEGREAEVYYEEYSGQYIKGSASYFLGKDGEKLGYQVETVDVTQMVMEQIKIEEQRTLLDKVFSASPDLIWYKDSEGRYLTVNPRFAAMAGHPPEEFPGKTAREILPDCITHDYLGSDRRAIELGAPYHTEDRTTFADGHEEILDSVRTPIYDPNGQLVGLLGYARDVSARVTIESELRQTQIDLEKAVSEANSANEHKGEFLARMSHEIRTPMNAIIGITTILLNKLSDMEGPREELADVQIHVRQIESSSQHLLGLLNDILDISKIEAGKIELMEETVELAKLAATVAGIIKPRCDEKNIAFMTHFDSLDEGAFLTDSLRLRQVLINLLGNAVKFTPECGAVEFRVEKKDRRDGKTLVEFSVADNGIGIAPEALAAIFRPFEQENGNISRRYGGTGLGLTISQRIVQMFGGKIAIDSQVGEGSEFRFSIWLTETDSIPTVEVEVSDPTNLFAGKRALLVDDVEINRMIVVSMLEATGLDIDEADDGQVAVKRFEESGEGYYDLILMDVIMPNMDGYEAATAIRSLSRMDARRVPIVALTANAFKDDIEKALRHGMNAHIAKPIEMDRLIEVLFHYLSS